jgi:hypothetical protein
MSDEKDINPLIQRVDALMRRQQEDTQRAVQEVPLLTEVVEPEPGAATKDARSADEALVEDIERAVLVQLVPELNRQIAGLRSGLEKELRKAVRQSVAHAVAHRKAKPAK